MAKSILLLLLVTGSAVAQTATGSIAGTVTDPASAVVPSAKVVLTNIPAPYTFGNTPRELGFLRAPGTNSIDFSIFKNFPVTERAKLRFRTEIFNIFNHPEFGLPGTAIGSATAGVISSQANTPRDIQMALKLIFRATRNVH